MAFPYLDDPPPAKGRTGIVQAWYLARSGSKVWMIAWDDAKRGVPQEAVTDPGSFSLGQRVRLVGGRLTRLSEAGR